MKRLGPPLLCGSRFGSCPGPPLRRRDRPTSEPGSATWRSGARCGARSAEHELSELLDALHVQRLERRKSGKTLLKGAANAAFPSRSLARCSRSNRAPALIVRVDATARAKRRSQQTDVALRFGIRQRRCNGKSRGSSQALRQVNDRRDQATDHPVRTYQGAARWQSQAEQAGGRRGRDCVPHDEPQRL